MWFHGKKVEKKAIAKKKALLYKKRRHLYLALDRVLKEIRNGISVNAPHWIEGSRQRKESLGARLIFFLLHLPCPLPPKPPALHPLISSALVYAALAERNSLLPEKIPSGHERAIHSTLKGFALVRTPLPSSIYCGLYKACQKIKKRDRKEFFSEKLIRHERRLQTPTRTRDQSERHLSQFLPKSRSRRNGRRLEIRDVRLCHYPLTVSKLSSIEKHGVNLQGVCLLASLADCVVNLSRGAFVIYKIRCESS